jgi:hypothetical protein
MNILKSIINISAMIMILAFIVVLIVESAALIAGVPIVTDNIEHPRVSTESDLILEGNASSFSISPHVNGTTYEVEGHTIFVPDNGFEEGRIYHLENSGENLDFMAVKQEKLSYNLIGGFKDHIVIAFNMGVNRSALNSSISFSPNMSYSVEWHHNTVIIEPKRMGNYAYDMHIKGNISDDNRNRTVNITVKYISSMGVGNTFMEPSSFPSVPSTYTFIIIPPGLPILTGILSGASFLGYYIFIVGTIVISLAYMGMRYGKKTYTTLRNFIRKADVNFLGDNAIIETGALFFASISFTIIFYLIAEIFNPNPKIPGIGNMSVWEQLYALARASVWEELITRIPFIGIPLLFVHLYRNRGMKPLYSYIIGGNLGVDFASMSLVTICAFMFGFVHMIAGWDAFKILPAMVGGMAMGYLFVKYGIWASIALHFATDYLSMPSTLWPSTSLDMATNLFVIGSMVIGVYFLYIYTRALVEELFFPKRPERSPKKELPPPPPPFESISDLKVGAIPYAPYPFRCSSCGNTEAEYLGNGLLRCTRCGSLYRFVPFIPEDEPYKKL